MLALGISLASEPAETALCCVGLGRGRRPEVAAFVGLTDEELITACELPDRVAIDAPFGFARAFTQDVFAWAEEGSWSAEREERAPYRRATERFVEAHTPLPLFLSERDNGAFVRCAGLLDALAARGGGLDLVAGRAIEAYAPAALGARFRALVAELEPFAGETFSLAVPLAEFVEPAKEPVRVAVEAALERLAQAGHRPQDIELPETGPGTLATAPITSRESADAVSDVELKSGAGLGEVARERLASRFRVSDGDLRAAREAAERIRAELLRVLEGADAIACATSPLLPPRQDDTDGPSPVAGLARGRYIGHFTGPFGLAGLPVMSLPCGWSPEGLPVGLQLVGRPFGEARLLRLAKAVEDTLGLTDPRLSSSPSRGRSGGSAGRTSTCGHPSSASAPLV